jgi:signal transduction histidine kinase
VAVSVVRLDQRDEALRELLVQLAVANLVALALASGVGYRLARGALDPVERYRARAERITRGATGVRLDVPPGPRDEISRLGSTLNAMLAAQERAAARQGQFVDDASHELRTPLSALSAEVELALARDRPAEELRDALRRIADDTARLSALADELLTLGSLGRTTADARPIAASEACERAAGRARTQLGDGSGRPVVVEAAEELRAWADPGLLDRALGNLVDNAVRHGAGTITVSARAVDEPAAPACVLAVHDEGPGPPGGDVAQRAGERPGPRPRRRHRDRPRRAAAHLRRRGTPPPGGRRRGAGHRALPPPRGRHDRRSAPAGTARRGLTSRGSGAPFRRCPPG